MDKFWLKYPELSSARFTYENSGRYNYAVAPYDYDFVNDKLAFVKCPSSWNGEPIGYTLNPPMFNKQDYGQKWVGIMFEIEDEDNGGHVDMWWHYPI